MSEVTTLASLTQKRQTLGKLVLVGGNFNNLHPGHVRLLRFARSCGDCLAVAVNSDSLIDDSNYNDEAHRLDVVASLGDVDYCFVNDAAASELVAQLQPWAVVKGKEYEVQENPEQHSLADYGGRLIFSSGDTFQKSASILSQDTHHIALDKSRLNGYVSRHALSRQSISGLLERFSDLRVLVIGDSIVDEYVQCNAIGMSQEDPTIVVTPDESKLFLGGAAITSAHAKSLGAKSVSFFTVVGDDPAADFVKGKLDEYNIHGMVFVDETRPTTQKRRYRVGSKTLLRVNDMKDHDIERRIQQKMWNKLSGALKDADVVIFSDFNYGILPQPLVDKVTEHCNRQGIFVAADSQTSSQVGDIGRFKQVNLITPTEREVRVSLNNTKDGLVILAEKLRAKTQCKHIVVTLAEEGAFIHEHRPRGSENWINDKIRALASNAVDPAGAGDCFLASASLSMAAGGDIWAASLIGSVAAACQVSKVGNSPLAHAQLADGINQLL